MVKSSRVFYLCVACWMVGAALGYWACTLGPRFRVIHHAPGTTSGSALLGMNSPHFDGFAKEASRAIQPEAREMLEQALGEPPADDYHIYVKDSPGGVDIHLYYIGNGPELTAPQTEKLVDRVWKRLAELSKPTVAEEKSSRPDESGKSN